MSDKNLQDEKVLETLFDDFSERNDGNNVSQKAKKQSNNSGLYIKIGIVVVLFLLVAVIYLLLAKWWSENSKNNDIVDIIDNTWVSTTNTQEKQDEKNDIPDTPLNNFSQATTTSNKIATSSPFSPFVADESWGGSEKSKFSSTWWEENLSVTDSVITVSYPKWSYKPSASPRGGAGFIYSIDEWRQEATLEYDIKFAENFDFVRGWKLPGLCGGNCARWKSGEDQNEWFSLRGSWKKDGAFDTTLNYPGSPRYGQSLWISDVFFQAGKKYRISQRIKLNSLGNADGQLELQVNYKTIYLKEDVVFRTQDVNIDALLFTTFFGGSDESYATPVDTEAYFSNFNIK